MGKGTIISGGDKGQYTIDVIYNSDAYDREIALLDQQIADLQIKYDNAPETTAEEKTAKSILKLQLTSLNKRKENLQAAYSINTQKTVWCADLTEDLSGSVGTIEVPGESTNMQIQPGHENNANYDSNRDGQLQLSYNMDYAGLFYNLAMLPGWQKWKPLFRYGTITAINNDLADITLEDIKSSQQAISINQTNTLTGVGFEYMTCDGAAFSEGDEVLIRFEGQDWTKPKIVGFKDNPKSCEKGFLYIEKRQESCFFWNLETNDYAKNVKDNNGQIIENWPVEIDSVTNFKSKLTAIGTRAIQKDCKTQYMFHYFLSDTEEQAFLIFHWGNGYQAINGVTLPGDLYTYANPIYWCKLTSLSNINDTRWVLISGNSQIYGVWHIKQQSQFLNGDDIEMDSINYGGGFYVTQGWWMTINRLRSLILDNKFPYMIVVEQNTRVLRENDGSDTSIAQWNVFSKKAADPTSLNPFDLPRNNALETAVINFLGALYRPGIDNDTDTYWSMEFLQ